MCPSRHSSKRRTLYPPRGDGPATQTPLGVTPQRWPRFQLLSGKARPYATSHPGCVQEPLKADEVIGVCYDTMCGLLLGRRTATSGHGMLSQWTPLTIQLTRARVLQHVAQAGGGFRLKPQWLLCLSPFSLACLLACTACGPEGGSP